ncbi:MAG: hypothetical protein A2Z47_01770 [Thermodesulfovibrio sp. RBG_19FT_COMBO_42_12]|nr:MAG: hypothetical protein A2Z47_01770 [Thermodesulfovibrio sp. RBG_19FT_COMBO_42_12]
MKRILLFALVVMTVFVMASTSVYAQQMKAPLGLGNIALKVDYIDFTDSTLEDLDLDTSVYGGLEMYGQVAPGLYLGAEVGYTNPDEETTFTVFDPFLGPVTVELETEITYVPIELNLKYAIEAAPNLVFDFGAGVSMNYAELEVEGSALGVTVNDSEDDWLFGGQFFADLNYKFGQFFIGVNAKYQITEDFEIDDIDTDTDFSNWRFGGQIGIIF